MKPAAQKVNVPIAMKTQVRFASLMLQSGFFIKNGTRKRKAPHTSA